MLWNRKGYQKSQGTFAFLALSCFILIMNKWNMFSFKFRKPAFNHISHSRWALDSKQNKAYTILSSQTCNTCMFTRRPCCTAEDRANSGTSEHFYTNIYETFSKTNFQISRKIMIARVSAKDIIILLEIFKWCYFGSLPASCRTATDIPSRATVIKQACPHTVIWGYSTVSSPFNVFHYKVSFEISPAYKICLLTISFFKLIFSGAQYAQRCSEMLYCSEASRFIKMCLNYLHEWISFSFAFRSPQLAAAKHFSLPLSWFFEACLKALCSKTRKRVLRLSYARPNQEKLRHFLQDSPRFGYIGIKIYRNTMQWHHFCTSVLYQYPLKVFPFEGLFQWRAL